MENDILHVEGAFKGSAGARLFFQQWVPASAKASVVIIHGIGEHCARYNHVARFLARRRYAVYTYDMRGHGRSAGQRGHVLSINDYLADIDIFIRILSPMDRVFLLGHSLGGLLAIRSAMDCPDKFKGIIASAPALGLSVKIPVVKKISARILSFIHPSFTMIDDTIQAAHLSHDPAIVLSYDKDPLITRRRSARFVTELLRTINTIRNEAGRLIAPCLFLQAELDRIISNEAMRVFYDRISSPDKSLKIYRGFYHEIFNEIGKDQPLADTADWLDNITAKYSF